MLVLEYSTSDPVSVAQLVDILHFIHRDSGSNFGHSTATPQLNCVNSNQQKKIKISRSVTLRTIQGGSNRSNITRNRNVEKRFIHRRRRTSPPHNSVGSSRCRHYVIRRRYHGSPLSQRTLHGSRQNEHATCTFSL